MFPQEGVHVVTIIIKSNTALLEVLDPEAARVLKMWGEALLQDALLHLGGTCVWSLKFAHILL
jgi:hypothetical protein